MTTIEGRAKEFRNSKEIEFGVTDLNGIEIGYIQGAIEQDRIARQEQREIDIQKAQKLVCAYCDDALWCTHDIGGECEKLNDVRKKMMEE